MLNQKLKELRIEYEITASRLAQFMKVSEQDILDWENGVKEPTRSQVQELADLFDISLHELLQEKAEKSNPTSSKAKEKGSTKTKKKKKTKTKHKTKKVKDKTVEKKQNWPLIIILILLLALGAVCGFLFWKYGDDYAIIKKKEYKVSDVVGSFYDENTYESNASVLTLDRNGSYSITYHDCSVETSGYGSWTIDKDVITLIDAQGKEITLKVQSNDKLKLTDSDIGCSVKKNDIFKRGTANEETENKEEEPTTTYVQTGQWSGSHTTLVVDKVTDTYVVFTMQSYDPANASNIAELKNIKGSLQSNTVSFTFDDDGFGNAGKGTIVFDETTAVFQIALTQVNDEAPWSIITSGTMSK